MSRAELIKRLKALSSTPLGEGDILPVASYLLPVWRWISVGRLGTQFVNSTHLAFHLSGPFDVRRFESSCLHAARLHPIVVARIDEIADRPYFAIKSSHDLQVKTIEPCPSAETAGHVRRLSELIWEPFEQQDSFCRVLHLPVSDSERYVALVLHHFISDPMSVGIMASLIFEHYFGRNHQTAGGAITFAQIADCLDGWSRSAAGAEARKFWQTMIADAPQTSLPRCAPESTSAGPQNAYLNLKFDRAAAARLYRYAQARKCTLSMVLMTIMIQALAEVNEAEDVCLICLSSLRNILPLGSAIGNFTDSLPVRADVRPGESFASLLDRVNGQWAEILRKYAISPDKTICLQEAGVDMKIARFSFTNGLMGGAGEAKQDALQLSIKPVDILPPIANADVSATFETPYLATRLRQDGLHWTLSFRADLYDTDKANRFAAIYKEILEREIAGGPDA